MKLLGMVLVIFSTSSLGYLFALKYKMRRWILKSMISSLNLLKIEITYSKAPLGEILMEISHSLDKSVKFAFLKTGKILSQNEGYTAGEAWEIALKEWDNGYLKKEDIEILKSFGYGLGNSDVYNQEKNFDLAIELLKRQLSNAEEESKKNEKLYKNIGVLAGLAINILFL
ncbi:stage III sporulation protein AB [Thermoanaerobacter italicus Ab9]|uniref:Stage III sporulation protein AB n=1 Tax=Thermoanaerobacter italicus (strain DSM 9252 / Ab9) TaxID=580331 RepID=D3T8R3_THEIA|nr:stage III sporulation protein SpoIIIAB [Thermoanaerobacter italicus]ADD02345.1 stage III sporulation protein AB [Thermoanaerobacter italicus Ab9]